MKKENFLLVSLKEEESKHLAQVISNKTSRKVLDLLAEKSMTETEISKKLNLPMSTVHYNMQALMQAKLVTAEEYHYSEKGKEVNHYSLANKYVIIAPKDAPSNLRERLKRILPTAIIGAGASGAIYLYQRFAQVNAAVPEPGMGMLKAVMPAEDAVREPMMQLVPSQPNLALWFLLGVAATIVIFVIVDFILSRK